MSNIVPTTKTLSPVEELREVARLMRERAEKATPGPWQSDSSEIYGDTIVDGFRDWVGETCDPDEPERTDANATHMASWHPTVALAVADLLTVISWFPSTADPTDMQAALAVARAYLGGTR